MSLYFPTYDCLDQVLCRADLAKRDLEVVCIVECIQEVAMKRMDILGNTVLIVGSNDMAAVVGIPEGAGTTRGSPRTWR